MGEKNSEIEADLAEVGLKFSIYDKKFCSNEIYLLIFHYSTFFIVS
ncbi:MAG: hypothetical protein ABSG15_10925 [FCB group bacterium]|jgi:hypothetical protein